MANNTVIGGLISLFQADATLSGLVPAGAWMDEVPPDLAALPFVVMKDEGQEEKWLTKTISLVRQKVRLTAYAEAATVDGADNPAEAVAAACRAALNGMDPASLGPKLTPIGLVETSYSLKESPKRSAAGNRVDVADMAFLVVVERRA